MKFSIEQVKQEDDKSCNQGYPTDHKYYNVWIHHLGVEQILIYY